MTTVSEFIFTLGKYQETDKYILWKNVELLLVTLIIYIYIYDNNFALQYTNVNCTVSPCKVLRKKYVNRK